MIREVLKKVQEELSPIAKNDRTYLELISNRCIPLELGMMKRLGYAYDGEKAFHLTNSKHLDGLYKIQNTKKQLSTFTVGGPELMRLPSQPDCLVSLEGTEVIRGKSDIWTTVDRKGMRWINHNIEERSTKYKLTFMIDGILTRIFREYGINFDANLQPSEIVLEKLESIGDESGIYKMYLKLIEKWLDSGGYKEFQKYLDNAAEMKYNEVVLTKFKIIGVNSLEVENVKVKKFCEKHNIPYLGVLGIKSLSNIKI